MTFRNAVINTKNNAVSRTANGMKANATSANAVLDFFGLVGSSRGTDLTRQFTAALVESEELTLRTLLWTRDVRGGAGERKQFRDLLVSLEKSNPTLAGRLIHKVPEVGRWDDLFVYTDPINQGKAFDMIGQALRDGNPLAAKWMPRKGLQAAILRKHLGMTPKQYRKTLVNLTNVVETQMCAKNWDEINFSHVPSLAAARYQKAFDRNASEEYAKYIAELSKAPEDRDPKVKINAGAVYPYNVVKSVYSGNEAVANAQWKALPNYVGDARIMPMVDVSGSMGPVNGYGDRVSPMQVAMSLGLYLSEKNTSEFSDMFLTFSAEPKFVTVKGALSLRLKQMLRSEWGMNTNLHAAFDEILRVAVSHNVKPGDMPEMLLILSDMQFDHCTRFDDNAQEMIKRKYTDAGYEVPKIVFWNLSMYGSDNTPIKFNDRGVALVSGFSPAIMTSVLADDLEGYTPYNVMLKTIMSDRYAY